MHYCVCTVSEFCGRNMPGRLQLAAHGGDKAETSQMGAALASHVSDVSCRGCQM